ncbi:MAG: hypothetical protein IIV14_00700 [Bacteroidaceae bacterium]|nr:hypothetical protein [Bacteroidaceae bacterium]
MTREQRIEIEVRIDKMIGSREQQRIRVQSMILEDRINSNNRYEKMRGNLLKIAEKKGIEALTLTFIEFGRTNVGVTASGKKFIWTGNNGMTERSRYCGDLYIEGIGTVFTSGTIAKAVEYITNN